MPESVDTARALGALTAQVTALTENQRRLIVMLEEEQRERREAEAAAQGYRAAINRDLDRLAATQKSMDSRIQTIEPIAQQWTRWQLIGLGIVITVGAAGSLIGFILSLAKDQIASFFRGIT